MHNRGHSLTCLCLALASAATVTAKKGCFADVVIAESEDSWDQYEAGGMNVLSVTGGSQKSNFEKTVVMLHGGGGSGSDWVCQYQDGWFGNMTGIKYVFPTTPLDGNVWFNTYKGDCGLADDCAYDIPSIQEAATSVAALLESEMGILGGDNSKLYLAGFSEGAQLTGYTQIAKLNYPLGGVIIMDGYPIPPLCDMPGKDTDAAKQNATYYGTDMNWMIWHGNARVLLAFFCYSPNSLIHCSACFRPHSGEADYIFPCDETLAAWNGIFEALEIQSTLAIEHTEPLQGHTLIESEFDAVVEFVRGS